MAGLNQVNLIGYLGRDPETRHTPGGKAVANFSVACNESWKDENGEKQERTEWVRCQAWGRLAEICGEYLKKGTLVYVCGRMQTRKYEKDGVDHYATDIVLSQMQMLGGKSEGGYQPKDADAPYEAKRGAKPPQAPRTAPLVDDGFDNDIPFAWAIILPLVPIVSLLLHGSASVIS